MSSSDEDTSGDEWEDVGGDFDARADRREQEDETRRLSDSDVKERRNGGPRRALPPIESPARDAPDTPAVLAGTRRGGRRRGGRCWSARARRAPPRGVAFLRLTRAERGAAARAASLVPFLSRRRRARVARLAKWFAGAFECRAFSKTVRRYETRTQTRTTLNANEANRPKPRTLAPGARRGGGDVVLGDDDDSDATTRRGTDQAGRFRRTFDKRTTSTSLEEVRTTLRVKRRFKRRSRTRASPHSCLPRLRLAAACARRAGN